MKLSALRSLLETLEQSAQPNSRRLGLSAKWQSLHPRQLIPNSVRHAQVAIRLHGSDRAPWGSLTKGQMVEIEGVGNATTRFQEPKKCSHPPAIAFSAAPPDEMAQFNPWNLCPFVIPTRQIARRRWPVSTIMQ